jgi:hypothetical protein
VSTPSPPPDPEEPVSAEDAAWRAIVENYGDRPALEDPSVPAEPEVVPEHDPGLDVPGVDVAGVEVPGSPRDLTGPVSRPAPEDRFVPPAPPPLPTPPPARLLAWFGLFGVPFVILVALVARIAVPSWLGLLLMVWFVGGFVFLVASMGPGPGDDHDDGARL